jgi:hypothetical protein
MNSAIRFNIVHAELLIAENKDPRLIRLNKFGELSLAVAYFKLPVKYCDATVKGVAIVIPAE